MTLSNAKFETLKSSLLDLHENRYDFVVHPSLLVFSEGKLNVHKKNGELLESCELSKTALSHLSEKLGVPANYFLKLQALNKKLFALTINSSLDYLTGVYPDKCFLIRTYRQTGKKELMVRAILSDRYRCLENFKMICDAMLVANVYTQQNKRQVETVRADLTDNKMFVSLRTPDIEVKISPLTFEDEKTDFPDLKLSGGLVLSNSETGFGRFTIAPRLSIGSTGMGFLFKESAVNKTHLGRKLEPGIVTDAILYDNKDLRKIRKSVQKSFNQFFDPVFIEKQANVISRYGGVKLKYPENAILNVCKAFKFTEEETDQMKNIFEETTKKAYYIDIVVSLLSFAASQTQIERQYEIESDFLRTFKMLPRQDSEKLK